MPSQPKMLIVTTDNDPSLSLFEQSDAASIIKPFFASYGESNALLTSLLQNSYDYVYFRDPFNSPNVNQDSARAVVETVMKSAPSAYFVDHIASYEDMLFEDKWLQYQKLSKYMPPTKLLQTTASVRSSGSFIKKRISSRAKGIIFTNDDFPNDAQPADYIIQPKLSIEYEYRVFLVGGSVALPIAIRNSKTAQQKVKMTGITNELDPEITAMCTEGYRTTGFDLMGLDIAKTPNGYVLLETNRSCQFKAYFSKSSVNLAAAMNEYLVRS